MNPVVKQILEVIGFLIVIYAVWQFNMLLGLIALGIAVILLANSS